MFCGTCHQSIETITGKVVDVAIGDSYSWDTVFRNQEGTLYHTPLGEFKLVAKQLAPDYDDCIQGNFNEVYFILERSGQFFKKQGGADSYGDVEWNSGMTEVYATTKTVLVFE